MATMHPATVPPAPAVMRILGRFDREHLSAFMEVAVELLDALDGDLDLEETGCEDSFEDLNGKLNSPGAGCPISDTDHCAAGDDNLSWVGHDCGAGDPEDAEDGGDTEPNGDEGDYSDGDGGPCVHYGVDQTSAISERNPALV